MKYIVVAAIVAVVLVVGCSRDIGDADRKQAVQTATMLEEAQRQIGMPNMVNYQQRKQMKMIYELADRADLITYTYLFVEYTGKFVFLGKSVGFGVPFSAQFTNPERVVEGDKMLGYDLAGYINHPMIMPQADPNGLFMPTSSSATWVMLIDPKTNKPRPIYIEPQITVSPFPLSMTVGKDMVIGNDM